MTESRSVGEVDVGQGAVAPPRDAPGPLAEHPEQGRDQHHPDHGGVEQDGQSERPDQEHPAGVAAGRPAEARQETGTGLGRRRVQVVAMVQEGHAQASFVNIFWTSLMS